MVSISAAPEWASALLLGKSPSIPSAAKKAFASMSSEIFTKRSGNFVLNSLLIIVVWPTTSHLKGARSFNLNCALPDATRAKAGSAFFPAEFVARAQANARAQDWAAGSAESGVRSAEPAERRER